MAGSDAMERWRTDGKFFQSGSGRVWMRAVTYGPFPGGWPEDFAPDFERMAAAGFNAVRLFEMPETRLLEAAERCGLRVFAGLRWAQNVDFFGDPGCFTAARVALVERLREIADHPALAGVYVGNEIPADLVRWMGPLRVREAIEDLIALGREVAPHLLFAYANYPSTEYLEPENADFTAFNIYLEEPGPFRSYLKRLHHIAGDRPLVVSEFGLDSRRNGLSGQAESFAWGLEISHEEETAGFTAYAWSDRWWTAGAEVLDWDFGLIDREGNDKPALAAVSAFRSGPEPSDPGFSVIICTRNGRGRIGACLEAVTGMDGEFETLVVDDGSEDGTAEYVEEQFPEVRLLRLDPCGLSAARNAGAEMATGRILAFTDDDCTPDREWLVRLSRMFAGGRFAAVGGPNLPPAPQSWHEAVVCSAPGAPSHVMLDDEEAEHLPGCNLAVTKAAFEAVGGFDPQFRTAGDDVDFCWRLREAEFVLGFAPGAFVWHRRRPSVRGFLKQQIGYGLAESLLIEKHPARFTRQGRAKWQGFVYGGGPVRVMPGSVLYHGPMGTAGYQMVASRMLPLRGLASRFDTWKARFVLRLVGFVSPLLRSVARNRVVIPQWGKPLPAADPDVRESWVPGVSREELLERLLADGWTAAGPTDGWDAGKQGTRVLLATERLDQQHRRTLVRVWGGMACLPFDWHQTGDA